MLTVGEITARVARGEIGWSGEMRGDGLLLRLGTPLQALNPRNGVLVDLADQDSIDCLYAPPDPHWLEFDLAPGRIVLCAAGHPLRLAAGLAGAFGTLSHLARVGLATHLDSPWVMPGWNGYLTMELSNCGPATLKLHRGMPVARVLVFAMDGAVQQSDAHTHYGSDVHLGSRYASEFGHELGHEPGLDRAPPGSDQ